MAIDMRPVGASSLMWMRCRCRVCVHGDSVVDRPIDNFRSDGSLSRQAGLGECVQGSADRPRSTSSAMLQFCGESSVYLCSLAVACIVCGSVLAWCTENVGTF